MLPIKARQNGGSQAGAIHFHNLFMLEEFIKATAEMPARVHHNGSRLADIKAEMVEYCLLHTTDDTDEYRGVSSGSHRLNTIK